MNDWKKIEPGQTRTWDPEAEQEVSGVLKQVKTGIGPNESNMYILKREGNEDIAVWGSAVIDTRMNDIELGSEVKIVYLGKEKAEKSGRTYRNFEVYTRPKPDFEKVPYKGDTVKDMGGDIEIPVIEPGDEDVDVSKIPF